MTTNNKGHQMTPQPLPEGYDPADYIAVRVRLRNADGTHIEAADGLWRLIDDGYAFALSAPLPTPPPWADVPPEGVWHATGASILDNGLDWGYSDDDIDGKHRDATEPDRVYYAREPQRRTAAKILDQIEVMVDNDLPAVEMHDVIAEYRAALTAEAEQA